MTAPNTQKTPIVESVQTAAFQKVQDAMALVGKALPATVTAVNGSIVTVQFNVTTGNITLPSVTIAKAESQWIRTPTQVGDQGMVIPADVYMGGATGLGGGTADLSLPPNLTALVWVPVANSSWTADDANAAMVVGPNGAIIRDSESNSIIHLTPTQITITRGSGVVTMTASSVEFAFGSNNMTVNNTNITFSGPVVFDNQVSGSGGTINFGSTNLTTTGTVTSNSVVLSTHIHSGVQTGSGDSGPPV